MLKTFTYLSDMTQFGVVLKQWIEVMIFGLGAFSKANPDSYTISNYVSS